ncbi:MAG: hypothetical protein PWR09_226 [Archaeoglobi archaeon]|nr:hypothetical protein [Candidatus Mnemosynella bozhongmuii]MDI3502102.1 hypothetical protein [Archaeoglobi archaeon]
MIERILERLLERDFIIEFEDLKIEDENLDVRISGRIKVSVRSKNED